LIYLDVNRLFSLAV